jgi:hypothetical protein
MTANVMRREDNAQPSRLLLDVTLVGARTKQTLGACFLLLSALGSKAGVCGCTSPMGARLNRYTVRRFSPGQT